MSSRPQDDEAQECSLGDHELRDDEDTTCLACINRARRVLREIEESYELLPDALRTLTGISYDSSGPVRGDVLPVPGGDALVMLAGGKFGGVSWGRPTRKEPDGSHEHLEDQWEQDPPSVVAVLAELEDDWRHARGDAPAPYEPSVARCADYLRRHMTWAAQRHEQWVEQRRLLDWLHARLEVVTGTSTRPEPVGAPCMHCGGRIVRVWREDGLSDAMVCQGFPDKDQPGCGASWEHDRWVPDDLRATTLPATYLLAQRAALEGLPETNPDLAVTASEAKRILRGRVRPNTIDQWVARGVLAETGFDVRGAPTYRLGDIEERVEAIPQQQAPRRSEAS